MLPALHKNTYEIDHPVDGEQSSSPDCIEIPAAEILIVEDDPSLQRLLVLQLKKLGFRMLCAMDGGEAVVSFKTHRHFRLILMDIMMPMVDGYEATTRIRDMEKIENLGHVAIVGVTATSDRQACIAAGMDDYYQKPLRWNQLEEIVKKWLPLNLSTEQEADIGQSC